MRTTVVCLKQHIDRGFKFRWLLLGRRKIGSTGAAEILAAKGTKVVDAHEVLSPPFHRPQVNHIFPLQEKLAPVTEEQRRPCYVFHDRYSPPAGLAQIQHLTNSVVRCTLPSAVLNQIKDNSAEEDSKVQEAILHAHVLDSHQEKLPRIIDVVNRPGWNYPLKYGMPVRRKNKNMTYQLLLLLDQFCPNTDKRRILENTKIQVHLEHSGQRIQMEHEAAFMISSSTPLLPLVGETEVVDTEEELIPDIYPLSPFLHSKPRYDYSNEEYDSVATEKFFPRTIFIHKNMPRMPHTDDSFGGITLMKAFSHTAAYAKRWCKIENGNLVRPLTLQVVHTNAKKYHIGVFQLNTLNLTGKRKNIFWHPSQMENIFEDCHFEAAEAKLKGYNPKVFSLLKALHMQ